MRSLVLVSTSSGAAYVLSVSERGVRWRRVPGHGADVAGAAHGWEPMLPRIVPGERLMIGRLRSTPVVSVAVLPT
jgi:hypothetical protein